MDYFNLRRDEAAMWKLRELYECRGFRHTPVAKFEDYNLYMDNKSFLSSDHIITFMDMDGRLLALKPDITLSIVKNIPKQPLPLAEKLFYIDEVYRLSRENREYRVLNQIGVEWIWRSDPFANLEVVDLAIRSLALIDKEYILDISHLGFVSGLFESAGLSPSLQSDILAAIHKKSLHDVKHILAAAEILETDSNRILALVDLRGAFENALDRMKPLICNKQMQEAYDELSNLEAILRKNHVCDGVFLDFSVVGDLDYYNGLVFLGYVRDVPRAVLTGGRYDNLLKRMGKNNCAIGFAVNLSELVLSHDEHNGFDFDLLITYDASCDFATLLSLSSQYMQDGKKIRLEAEGFDPSKAGFSYRKHFRFNERSVLEEVVATC